MMNAAETATASKITAAYPATGGYDKHDLTVIFADGETYQGRLDCKADGSDCDARAHVRESVEFMAGARCPAHMTAERYKAFLANDLGTVGEALAFLATYEL